AYDASTTSHMVPVGQASLGLDWFIPLQDATGSSQKGLITIAGAVGVAYLNDSFYTRHFGTPSDPSPSHFPLWYLINGAFHVFDELYVSAGYATSSVSALNHRSFVALSYSRPKD